MEVLTMQRDEAGLIHEAAANNTRAKSLELQEQNKYVTEARALLSDATKQLSEAEAEKKKAHSLYETTNKNWEQEQKYVLLLHRFNLKVQSSTD